MGVEDWTLLVTTLSLPTALVTLVVVVRTEIRSRKKWPAIMWAFSCIGSRTSTAGDEHHHVLELVQFGGTPTRVMCYFTVNFRVDAEEGARLRAYIRGEDELRLFATAEDPGSAWLLVVHTPRHMNGWWLVEWLALDPVGPDLRERIDADIARERAYERSLRGRISRFCLRLFRRQAIRPVGPGAARWGRFRDPTPDDLDVLFSVARKEDPESGALFVHS